MTTSKWTSADLPSLDGKTFVVTGANSGIGLAATRMLTGAGAHVVLAVRDPAKGEQVTADVAGATRCAGSTWPTSSRCASSRGA
jgi:NAD(P)-dependent dehydrogenase (short-subunit alcohol dehydrogenase family)